MISGLPREKPAPFLDQTQLLNTERSTAFLPPELQKLQTTSSYAPEASLTRFHAFYCLYF